MPADGISERLDFVLVGFSRAPKIPLKHVRALSDAPLSARGLEDNEFLAMERMGVFMNSILLKENLRPLIQFVNDRLEHSMIDPIEFPLLRDILNKPITGVMWEISQWRLKDEPMCYLFKRWRQDKFPDPGKSKLFTYYHDIYNTLYRADVMETHPISPINLGDFTLAIGDLYKFIEAELDPHLKRIWAENQIFKYQQWEGKATEDLGGRLTKEYVDERLRHLRWWLSEFKLSAEGIIEYKTRNSINPN